MDPKSRTNVFRGPFDISPRPEKHEHEDVLVSESAGFNLLSMGRCGGPRFLRKYQQKTKGGNVFRGVETDLGFHRNLSNGSQ